MDNMDGAAATVVGISATGTGALAIVVGDAELAPLCFAVAGGCVGFLPRNLARPSRIFMGDGGSMPLGLLVAGTSMQVASAGNLGVAGVLEIGLIVGLAILDTTLVMVSRRRGGRPLMTGGRDHLTHRLRTRVGTPSAVAGSLASLQLVLCAAAIVAGLVGAGAILGVTALVLAARRVGDRAARAAPVVRRTGGEGPGGRDARGPAAARADPLRAAGRSRGRRFLTSPQRRLTRVPGACPASA